MEEDRWGERFSKASMECQKEDDQPCLSERIPDPERERLPSIHQGVLRHRAMPLLAGMIFSTLQLFGLYQFGGGAGIAFWIASTIVRASEPFNELAAKWWVFPEFNLMLTPPIPAVLTSLISLKEILIKV